jgi:flavin reductase (DIM6/NTAB) family NADH-FMN oxidoreductase RutF
MPKDVIGRSGAFAVNRPSSDQEPLAHHCACAGRPLAGEVARVPYTVGRTGCPLLRGAAAYVACTLHHACDGGAHTICVGAVQATTACAARRPVLHGRRQYLVWTAQRMGSGNSA